MSFGLVIDLLQTISIGLLIYVVWRHTNRIDMLESPSTLPDGASPVPDSWIDALLQQLNGEAGESE